MRGLIANKYPVGTDGVKPYAAFESSPSKGVPTVEHDDDCRGQLWHDRSLSLAQLHRGWLRRELAATRTGMVL